MITSSLPAGQCAVWLLQAAEVWAVLGVAPASSACLPCCRGLLVLRCGLEAASAVVLLPTIELAAVCVQIFWQNCAASCADETHIDVGVRP